MEGNWTDFQKSGLEDLLIFRISLNKKGKKFYALHFYKQIHLSLF